MRVLTNKYKNMKQNIDIEKEIQSQNEQGKLSAFEFINCRMILISAILPAGKGTQHLGRDGPPGRARSPGINFRKELHALLFNTKMIINYLIKPKIQLFTNINFLQS